MAMAQILLASVMLSPVISFLERLPSTNDNTEDNGANWITLQRHGFFSTSPYLRFLSRTATNYPAIASDQLNGNVENADNLQMTYAISKGIDKDSAWKITDDNRRMNLKRRSLYRVGGGANEKRNTLQRLAMNGARGFGRR